MYKLLITTAAIFLSATMFNTAMAWRQCEDNQACGSGHHCCEIANGESRCYSDQTPCP